MTFSIYTLADGLFTGLQLAGDESFIDANLPDGCAAWPGAQDPRRVRVDLATQALVPYQPPAPANNALMTWEWDAAAWAWVAAPTGLALAQDMRAERDRRLAACDWVVARASERGEPVPTAWATYRQALRDVPDQSGFPGAVVWPATPAA